MVRTKYEIKFFCPSKSQNKMHQHQQSIFEIFSRRYAPGVPRRACHSGHLIARCLLEITEATIHNALGPLEPSRDSYVTQALGQKIYLEPADMEQLKVKGFPPPPEMIDKLVQRFQIGVKFVTKEKFYITESDGGIVQGSKNSVVSHHMWLFESPFMREKLIAREYPLSWKVVDMDQWVQFRLPRHRPMSSFFK